MTTTSNTIPREQQPLVQLSAKALTGAIALGATIELEHNTSVEISADLYDLTGNPATPLIPGKQGLLNEAKEELRAALDAAFAVRDTARKFCAKAVNLLKPILGTKYNGEWNAAGFLVPSLQAPSNPTAMLLEFRQYFERHPTHENAPLNLTAVQAQSTYAALQAAELARATAEANRVNAKEARDLSKSRLITRMSNLRKELEQLLEDNDPRWYEFGFHRPVDGRLPSPVTGIVLTPVGPGTVLATWEASTLALNYRVQWSITGSSGSINDLGLFTDRQAVLVGLPTGGSITVGISARNDSGETEFTEATIVAP